MKLYIRVHDKNDARQILFNSTFHFYKKRVFFLIIQLFDLVIAKYLLTLISNSHNINNNFDNGILFRVFVFCLKRNETKWMLRAFINCKKQQSLFYFNI